MFKVCKTSLRLSKWCLIVLALALMGEASVLMAQSPTTSTADQLAAQIRNLEKQLAELTAQSNATKQIAAVPQAGQRGQAPAAQQGGGQRGQQPAAPAMPPGMVMPGGPV